MSPQYMDDFSYADAYSGSTTSTASFNESLYPKIYTQTINTKDIPKVCITCKNKLRHLVGGCNKITEYPLRYKGIFAQQKTTINCGIK